MTDYITPEQRTRKDVTWTEWVAAFFMYVVLAWAMEITAVPPHAEQTPSVANPAAAPDQITESQE